MKAPSEMTPVVVDSSFSLSPNVTNYTAFLEGCSLPELTWFMDSLAAHFENLLAQCKPGDSTALDQYLAKEPDSTRLKSTNIQIPQLRLDETQYSLKNLVIDFEKRSLSFHQSEASGAVDGLVKESSPLTAVAHFVADILATTLWDSSVKPKKHSRIRFISNTFAVLNGLHARFSQKWQTQGGNGSDYLHAVSVMQIVFLNKKQIELKAEQTTTKCIPVPTGIDGATAPPGFLPIQSVGSDVAKVNPDWEVASRDPIVPNSVNGSLSNGHQENHALTNGVDKVLPLTEPAQSEPLRQALPKPSHSSVTLVVPSAGRSSRFPGVKPKWMLTQPSGALMVVDALGALDLSNVEHVVIGLLREHVDKYCGGDVHAILSAFDDGVPRLREIKISIVVIGKETVDQVETIECILNAAKVQGPIFLKDCDNQFASAVPAVDGVSTLKITRETEGTVSNVASKSYVSLNRGTNQTTSIIEKSIISDTFCIGGYAFLSAADFLARVSSARHVQVLGNATAAHGAELAVSDIIWRKMTDPTVTTAPFISIPSHNYEDWGTLPSWRSYCDSFKTLFVDIDGTVVKNSGQYFTPTWGTTQPLSLNVAYLNELYATGRTSIILVTSRLERFREKTVAQLKEFGVRYDQLIMGMMHAKRVVINDYAPTNPFPAASAVNLARNAENLRELMG